MSEAKVFKHRNLAITNRDHLLDLGPKVVSRRQVEPHWAAATAAIIAVTATKGREALLL